jgi:hypothetical protein
MPKCYKNYEMTIFKVKKKKLISMPDFDGVLRFTICSRFNYGKIRKKITYRYLIPNKPALDKIK